MRKPSRTMPPSPSSSVTTNGCWLTLLILAFIYGGVAYHMPFVLVPLGVIATGTVVVNAYDNVRLSRLAAERQGESICTFARSFVKRSSVFSAASTARRIGARAARFCACARR